MPVSGSLLGQRYEKVKHVYCDAMQLGFLRALSALPGTPGSCCSHEAREFLDGELAPLYAAVFIGMDKY